MLVGQIGLVKNILTTRVCVKSHRLGKKKVSIVEARTCGDAMVHIVNGGLTFGVIFCPYEPSFLYLVRESGYNGIVIAMDPKAPIQRILNEGFDGGIKRLDDAAMKGIVRMMRDVVTCRYASEVSQCPQESPSPTEPSEASNEEEFH